jgi:hypothetical protein
MSFNQSRKVSLFTALTLTYECGCKVDVKKVSLMMVDKELEFASKVRCGECVKNGAKV